MAELQVICAWCGEILGHKECAWTEGAVSHGICETCLEGLYEVEIEGVSVETEQEWQDKQQLENQTRHLTDNGKRAMGPDSSERERSGLPEGEGIA